MSMNILTPLKCCDIGCLVDAFETIGLQINEGTLFSMFYRYHQWIEKNDNNIEVESSLCEAIFNKVKYIFTQEQFCQDTIAGTLDNNGVLIANIPLYLLPYISENKLNRAFMRRRHFINITDYQATDMFFIHDRCLIFNPYKTYCGWIPICNVNQNQVVLLKSKFCEMEELYANLQKKINTDFIKYKIKEELTAYLSDSNDTNQNWYIWKYIENKVLNNEVRNKPLFSLAESIRVNILPMKELLIESLLANGLIDRSQQVYYYLWDALNNIKSFIIELIKLYYTKSDNNLHECLSIIWSIMNKEQMAYSELIKMLN